MHFFVWGESKDGTRPVLGVACAIRCEWLPLDLRRCRFLATDGNPREAGRMARSFVQASDV
jgi:hypothetical protein